MLIFDHSKPGSTGKTHKVADLPLPKTIPAKLLRKDKPKLPEVSELQVVRHYTNLSKKNFCIDAEFYPLGSCTMKYNPRAAHALASIDGLLARHPLTPISHSQGVMQCLYELQDMLTEITGMTATSLTPMAGAQGELAGVAMIKAYHQSRNDHERTEILVPDAAHGTNPATASMCGYTIHEIPTGPDGDLNLAALEKAIGPKTAGIMLTNPSTLGLFERHITTVAKMIHAAGGLLYYDGANLNAILGKVKPGDMGFDVLHFNLHKTFATPHGGGGPGAGPVAVSHRLAPFLPTPMIGNKEGQYHWLSKQDRPKSIGRLSTFMGNTGVLLRAYIYMRMLGREGMVEVAEIATLNANYMQKRLEKAGFKIAYPERLATHEFVLTVVDQKKLYGVTALDYAKRLLDYGYHAPTIYFPLLIPECMLIEPTETESKETLDDFIDAMVAIKQEVETDIEKVKQAPHTLPVKRLDDVKAAREIDIVAF